MAEQEVSTFTLRISAELKATLERLADADGRSLNSYIARALARHVAEQKGKR